MPEMSTLLPMVALLFVIGGVAGGGAAASCWCRRSSMRSAISVMMGRS